MNISPSQKSVNFIAAWFVACAVLPARHDLCYCCAGLELTGVLECWQSKFWKVDVPFLFLGFLLEG